MASSEMVGASDEDESSACMKSCSSDFRSEEPQAQRKSKLIRPRDTILIILKLVSVFVKILQSRRKCYPPALFLTDIPKRVRDSTPLRRSSKYSVPYSTSVIPQITIRLNTNVSISVPKKFLVGAKKWAR